MNELEALAKELRNRQKRPGFERSEGEAHERGPDEALKD
jgi:hypothetical protein